MSNTSGFLINMVIVRQNGTRFARTMGRSAGIGVVQEAILHTANHNWHKAEKRAEKTMKERTFHSYEWEPFNGIAPVCSGIIVLDFVKRTWVEAVEGKDTTLVLSLSFPDCPELTPDYENELIRKKVYQPMSNGKLILDFSKCALRGITIGNDREEVYHQVANIWDLTSEEDAWFDLWVDNNV